MKLVIAPEKEDEWTMPLIEEPYKYLSGPISPELEEYHPIAAVVEKARLMAMRRAAGDPVAESKINDIFCRNEKPLKKLSALINYILEGG